jgi:tetratricopeptide (TPR) repeat protein
MERFSFLVCLAILVAGCSKEQTPEERAADKALAEARTALQRGNHENARQRFTDALTMDEKLGRTARVAEEYRELARIYADRAAFDTSTLYYSRATQEYRELADRASVRNLTIETARLHRLQGQERQAFAELEEALRLAKVFGDSAGVREIEMEILPSCRLLDIRDIEAQAVNDLLRMFATPSQANRLAAVYSAVGETQMFRQEYGRAAEHFLRAFTLSEQAHDSLRASESLLRMGVAFDHAGRTTEAFQSYSDAIKLADRIAGAAEIRIELLTRVGNAYLKGKQVDQAKRFYSAALVAAAKAGNKLEENYLALQLSLCDLDRNIQQAIQGCKTVVDFFAAAGYPRGMAYAQLCLGVALERANRVNESAQAYRNSVEQLESVRAPSQEDLLSDCEQAFFGRRRGAAYDELLDVLLRTGQQDQAFVFAQRQRCWEIRRLYGVQELERSAGNSAQAFQSLDQALAVRVGAERRLARVLGRTPQDRYLIGALRRALDRSAAAITARTEELVHASPMYAPFLKIETVPVRDLQRRVGSGRALVWYTAGKRSLYSFVFTPSKIGVQLAAIERERVYALASDLDRDMRRAEAHGDSVSKLAAIPDSRTLETYRQLYEAFLRPVDGDIASAGQLLVVLPDELSSVPLHALRRTQLQGSPYLAEQRLVSYVPGSAWVSEKGQEAANLKTIVGLGYAGSTGWDVEYELRDINAFYKEAKLFFGQRASLSTLQRETGDLLHLALEVRYTDQGPWNASVIMSDGKSLTSSTSILFGDLLLLPRFPAVVVSNLTAGQPYVPAVLAPLFLSNGARMVAITTYTPSRKLKKIFGEVFYTTLLGGSTPEQAFRKAQQDLIRTAEFSSPLVWGSYFLWGQ